MLYVSVESRKKAADYAKQKDLPYQVLADESREVARALGVSAIPAHFILDREGIVRFHHVGRIEGHEKALDRLVGEGAEGKDGR